MADTDSPRIKEIILEYFELAKTKEIEKIESYLDSKFTKFGDSPPYDRREYDRAIMLEQLQFASVSDYEFKVEDLRIQVEKDCALATFVLESSGILVDDYSFRGTTVSHKSRATVMLKKDNTGGWRMLHQHLSGFASQLFPRD